MSEPLPYTAALREFQLRYFAEVLKAAGGRAGLAAKLAGRNRTEIYRTFARLGLRPRDFRALAKPPEGA